MIRFSILLFITLQFLVTAQTKPNIIIIMNDQHHGGVLGSLGVKGLKTPKLDALRKQGIYFNNAYCTQPICVPSRNSMMTGKMPHEIGVAINRDSLPQDMAGPVLGELMTQAGYDTAYMGKTHLVGGAGRGFNTYHHTKERAVDHLLGDTAIEFIKKKRKKLAKKEKLKKPNQLNQSEIFLKKLSKKRN